MFSKCLLMQGRLRHKNSVMEKWLKKENYYITVTILFLIVAAMIIVYVLFIPPYVGMEDNGDFSRVIYGEGLYDLPENNEILQNGYFIKEYGNMQYYNEYRSTVKTSQFILIKPAIFLDRLFTGNDGIFDIRYLGLLQTIYFLIVMFFLLEYLTHRLSLLGSFFIGAISIFIFVDTGYIAYFNSFFAEPLAYTALLACVTCALLYADKRFNKYLVFGGFVINGLILTFSKQQFAPLGALLGVLILFFYLRKTKDWIFRILLGVSAVGLIAAGLATYLLISEKFTYINLYHSMTRGVLMTSDNPAETLEEIGIDSQYELLNKEIYFAKYPVIDADDEMLIDDFYSKYSIITILQHYVRNPSAFSEMLKLAAQNAYRIRPSLGNYEYSSGYPPNTLAQSFSYYSAFKETYAPKTVGFIIIWMIIILAILYKQRLKQIIIFAVILAGLSQILVSIIGAGDADLAKHVFLYNVAFDTVNVILAAHVIAFIDSKFKQKAALKAAKKAQEAQDDLNANEVTA